MFYFLTHVIDSKLAGLEVAMINRQKMFDNINEKSAIVTFQYNRFQHINTKKFGIDENHFVNMFDYFQGAVNLSKNTNIASSNNFDTILKKIKQNNRNVYVRTEYDQLIVYSDNEKIASVRFLSESKTDVSNIQWYSKGTNRVIRDDGYDTRGFLSISTFFGQNGGVASETLYRVDGKRVIDFYYHETSKNDNIINTAISLLDHKKEVIFYSLEAMTSYFYDILAKQSKFPVFIADRSYLVDNALFHMTVNAKKYEFWHNTFSDTNDQYGHFSQTMLNELRYENHLNGYIFPTKQAAKEIKNRLPQGIEVYTAPVSISKSVPLLDTTKKNVNKLIMVVRIDRQKKIEDAISAFSLIKDIVKSVHLYIYGYIFDMSYQEELLLLVNKLGLSKSVTFEHYTIDKSKIYRDAYLMLMTSRNEGWGIVIDEAMSYGVPVISYDTSYGPSEIITDNQDGYIIPIGDIDQMADKAIHLLKNKKAWNNFSKNL